jgi:hypothetical protein
LFKWWLKERKLDQLFDELRRIAAEDREYHSRTALSEQDHHAYVTRQTRRLDVLNRIAQINARNQRHSGRILHCSSTTPPWHKRLGH